MATKRRGTTTGSTQGKKASAARKAPEATPAVTQRGEGPGGIRPLRDRILVERVEEGEVRHGSIIIPDTAKEKPQEGRVIAAGSGRLDDDGKKIALTVKAGDRILFARYAGSEVRVEDRDYLILREEDVLAIVD